MASEKSSTDQDLGEQLVSAEEASETPNGSEEPGQSKGLKEEISETDVDASEEALMGQEEENGEEEDQALDQEAEEVDEEVEEVLDGDVEAAEGEVEESEAGTADKTESTTKQASAKKDEHEEEEDAEDNEEADKKIAEKFDPNLMPQVNVATLGQRRWQVKVYPLRPSDFMSGQISRVFKQAKESLLYVYTAGNNGRFSNGKAELYMSNIGQAVKVMSNLFKMDFFHPEANIKIIRKNEAGAVIEKAYMRYDTKMAPMLSQPAGPVRRIGSKRERIIGSVFLKNLPDGATKDMLRVMFPFAAEINFNPEKFKDSTARLVLSNRNSVIPCLKAFSKVELGGNILELRPLEKRKKLDDSPKKTSENDKTKSDNKAPSSKDSSKDANTKSSVKKDDGKSAVKEGTKKGPEGDAPIADPKDRRPKHGLTSKRLDEKRPRGSSTPKGSFRDNAGSKFALAKKYGNQGKFGQQQRYQGGFNSARSRGGFRGAGAIRSAGRGNFSGNRNRFSSGDAGFRGGASPGRMSGVGMGMADTVNPEMTKEMMHLQAQLSVAIKNQISMLNQTQLAVEQAKRGAAATTAVAAAAALGAGNVGGGFSRGLGDLAQQDQYSRIAEQSRRSELDSRQRSDNRNRQRDRRDNFGGRGSGRAKRGTESRISGYGPKRSSARAGFESDSFDDMPYPKRASYGLGTSPAQVSRSWAEESEDLDLYSRKSFGGSGSFRGESSNYGLDSPYGDSYDNRNMMSGSSRDYDSNDYPAGSRNLNYSNTSAYDYGY